MVTELKDTADAVFHEVFQRWRLQHPGGIFFTVETQSKANLHGAACHHLGSTDWLAEEGTGRHSLTRKLKVLEDGPGSLNAWARERSIAIHLCQHCLRDGFISESFLSEAKVEPTEAGAEGVVAAVEGITHEVTYLSYGRNAGLRNAALARARGVCEACFTNFGSLLGGLGAKALQVHHREQLALRDTPSVTKVEDLAVVCANCHAIIHANRESALTVEQVRKLWQSSALASNPSVKRTT